MARKDPRIVVLEDDLTTAGVAAASTDVVYVPGFADTNRNYLIYKKSGQKPDANTPGTPTTQDATISNINDWVENQQYPMYACNTVDQITWKCILIVEGADEYHEWVEQEVYVEPCPENVPVLCTNLPTFEAYFGKKPYQFTKDQDVSELFEEGAVAVGSKYMYRTGDYEKSYIYAKELVRAGLPVIYENIVSRGKDVLTVADQRYVREERIFTVTVDTTKYETAFGGEVNEDKIAVVNIGETSTTWKVGEIDVTEALTVTGATVFVGDAVVIKAKHEGAYAAEYSPVATPSLAVDNDTLMGYLKGEASKTSSVSYTEAFVFVYDKGWKKEVEVDGSTTLKDANIAEYGFSVSDEDLVRAGDKIIVNATYTEDDVKETPTVQFLYESLSDCYKDTDKLLDKGEFSVKYITSGAYPVYELDATKVGNVVTAMIDCAYMRGDAFAIIDHANNPERSLKTTDTSGSVYAHIKKTEDNGLDRSDDYTTFATMFTPWATYSCGTAPKKYETQLMPASFAYLMGMAQSVVTHPNWMAIAGVNRGVCSTIKSLNTVERLTNTIADNYQPRDERAINAITNIKPYGLTIWGNRTLVSNAEGNLTGKSFLNIRSLICDIKKVAYTAAKSLLFEQNTEILWNKFKTQLTPTLDKMVHGYGLSSYKIIKATTKYNGTPLAKGEIAAVIRIVPVYAVEDFEITVVMTDEGVEVN